MNDSLSPITPDDPRLTTYALGQMDPAERAAFETLLERDADARHAVGEIRGMADQLQSILRDEPEAPMMLAPARRPGFWAAVVRFPQGYYAAGLAAAACFVLYLAMRPAHPDRHELKARPQAAVSALAAAAVPEKAGAVELAPFEAQGGADSYDSVRQMILEGRLPEPQTVRTEAYVDAFAYAYVVLKSDRAFSLALEASRSPWSTNRFLLRVGVRARDAGPVAVARDLTLRLSLDPSRIARCRLIGYGDRPAQTTAGDLDFPVGELHGSMERTLLFELEPATAQGGEGLGFVSVDARYVDPDDNLPKVFGIGFPKQGVAFDAASASFRFATSVARFGTLLRHLPGDRAGAMAEVAAWARSATAQEPGEGRAEFAAVAQKASELLAAGHPQAGARVRHRQDEGPRER